MKKNEIKLTIEEVRLELYNKGLTLINNEYMGSRQDLTLSTEDGYMMISNMSKIKSNKIPEIFSKINPYTIQNIHLYLKLSGRGKDVLLISSEFKSANKEKLKWECLIDGEVFDMSWNNFHSSNMGCPICSGHKRYSKEEAI